MTTTMPSWSRHWPIVWRRPSRSCSTDRHDETGNTESRKSFRWKEVDFTVVPKLVQQAPGLLGAEGAPISHIALSGGVFCDKVGWSVYVGEGMQSAGYVVFRLDGKKKKIQRF